MTAATPSRVALPVMLAGTFMTILDFFIVNVAVPPMQQDLHATTGSVQLVVAVYALALAVGLITGGRLGDRYGRRRMFAVGLGGFTLASAGCGLAPTAEVLIATRAVQGLAAAVLIPQVLALLTTVYAGEQRARAFAAYGLTLGFGGVFGQLIGGALIALNPAGLGWRATFLVNVPVGLLALALVRRCLPRSGELTGTRLDLRGTALLTAGLVAIVLPLVEGQAHGWPAWTWLSLACAPVLIVGFLRLQRRLGRRGGDPLLDLSLFGERAFSAGLATCLTFFVANGSFFLFLAIYLQDGRGLSALGSGTLFLALGAGFFAALLAAGPLTARLGRQVLAVGALTTALGYGLLAIAAIAISPSGSLLWLTPGLLVAGAGLGFVIVPLTDVILAGIPAARAATAGGVLSTAQQLGGAVGVAIIGVVHDRALHGTGVAAHTHAFAVSVAVLCGFVLVAAALTQLLPSATTPDPRPLAAA